MTASGHRLRVDSEFEEEARSCMGCIALGTEAPDFALPTDTGATWRLSEHRGKPLILMFHRHLQ